MTQGPTPAPDAGTRLQTGSLGWTGPGMLFSRHPGAFRGWGAADRPPLSREQPPQARGCPRRGPACPASLHHRLLLPCPPGSQLLAASCFSEGPWPWSPRRAGKRVLKAGEGPSREARPGEQPDSCASGRFLADWPLDPGPSPWESAPSSLSFYFWLRASFLFMVTFGQKRAFWRILNPLRDQLPL